MSTQDTADRHTYRDEDALVPEIRHVGWTAPRTAGTYGLGAHHHAGWELCWLRKGTVDWWAGDGVHRVAAGNCYVTQPGERHGGLHDRLTPCELFWLELRPPRAGRWGELTRATTAHLEAALTALPHRTFPGEPALGRLWTALLAEHRHRDAHSRLAARALLHELLVTMLRCSARHAEQRPPPSPAIARALSRGDEHLVRGIGVAALARAADLSPSRFHARFLAEVGEAPGDWLRRRRIDRARQRLATSSVPITELALELGFPSSQHFAAVFRRYVGMTARDYRASVRAAAT